MLFGTLLSVLAFTGICLLQSPSFIYVTGDPSVFPICLMRQLLSLAATASFTKGAASKEFNVVQRRSLASTRSTPVGSKDLLGGFQTCQTKIDQHISTFGGYCETSNINAILRGLNEVRKSMVNLGSQCGSAYNLDKTSAVSFDQLFLRLQSFFRTSR